MDSQVTKPKITTPNKSNMDEILHKKCKRMIKTKFNKLKEYMDIY